MSGLQRIIWHWSAGTYVPGESDREHYHFFIDGEGGVHAGEHTPEDNVSTSDDDYAAHVSQFNTGSIGLAICAMNGAVEMPFDAGPYPILEVQVATLIEASARLCSKYGIEVGRSTTLSHAEVEPTCGVPQNGKWDISWLPGMAALDPPVVVGDILRERLMDRLNAGGVVPSPDADLRARLEKLEAWARGLSYTG